MEKLNKTIIGIDPGKSGGWVMKRGDKVTTGKLDPLSDFLQFARQLNPENTVVYLEKLTGFIAGKALPGSRMFRMGEYYFAPMYTLLACGIRVELVTPQKWQGALGCGNRGERNTTQWKNHLKDMAKRLYPNEKIVGWNADAYLILEYGLLRSEGMYEDH